MTTAVLGIEVRSDADRATAELTALTAAAKKAESEALNLTAAAQRVAAAETQAAAATREAFVAEDRLTAVRSRSVNATLHAANANDRLASSLRTTSLNTANVAAQFNDIGVTLASGMSPWMVAIQQGTQLNQVLGGQGVKGTVGLLAGAFTSLLNPVSLATIAIIGLGGTAIQYFSEWIAGSEKSAEELERQAKLVRAVADQWGEAVPALRDYINELDRAKEKADLIEGGKIFREDQYAAAKQQVADVAAEFDNVILRLTTLGEDSSNVVALQQAFADLQAKVAAGTATGEDARVVLDALGKTMLSGKDGSDALSDGLTTLIGKLRTASTEAGNMDREIARALGRNDRAGELDRSVGAGGIILPDTAPVPGRRVDPYFEDPTTQSRKATKQENQALRELEREREAVLDLISSLEHEKRVIGLTDLERQKANALRRAGAAATEEQKSRISELTEQIYLQKAAHAEAEKAADRQKKAMEQLGEIGTDALNGLADAFSDGKVTLEEIVTLVLRLIQQMQQMEGGLGGAFKLLFGGSPQSGPVGSGVAGPWGSSISNDNSLANKIVRMPLASIDTSLAARRNAIASIESAGSGDYSALGPINAKMGQALGRYQIMEANLPQWSRAALGRKVGRDEFMSNPDIQDSIFDHRFGGYVNKYGERGAAQAWFGGEGSVGKLGRSDVLGTTVGGYGDRYVAALQRMGARTDTAATALEKMTSQSAFAGQGLGSLGKGFDTFGSALSKFPSAPGAPSGGSGGFFSNLFGSIFGGGFTPFEMNYASSNIGLFASGTENAPPGWAWVGEEGPELRKLRAGDVIRSYPRSMQMAAEAGRGNTTVVNRINVVNNSGVQVRTEEADDGDGRRTDIIIEERLASAITRRGGAANKALSGMGVRRAAKVR